MVKMVRWPWMGVRGVVVCNPTVECTLPQCSPGTFALRLLHQTVAETTIPIQCLPGARKPERYISIADRVAHGSYAVAAKYIARPSARKCN